MRTCRALLPRLPIRRLALLSFALVVLAATALGPRAHRAAASWGWCWGDPIVRIDNTIVDIAVGVQGDPEAVRAHVQSAEITIHVAPGTSTAVLAKTNPYFPENVYWVYDGTRRADGSQTVRVDVTFVTKTPGAMPAGLLVAQVSPPGPKLNLSGQTVQSTTTGTMTATFTVR